MDVVNKMGEQPGNSQAQPELKLYYEDFGAGKADFSLVAENDGKVVGAVWTRIMNDYGV